VPETGNAVLRVENANPRGDRTENGRRGRQPRGRRSAAARAPELRRRIRPKERHRTAVQAARAQLVASVHPGAR